MEYLLIDFENVSSENFSGLKESQKILIFAGEKQTKVKMEMVQFTQPLGSKVEWVVINGTGKNAVDFHVAFYIGKYSEMDPLATFKIFSKDTGFDPLVRHLRSIKIDCSRIDKLPEIKPSKKGLRESISEFAEHLKSIGVKVRPKKVSKLKAYIKNRIRKEDSVVDDVLKGLISENHIVVQDEKVNYP